MGKLDAYIEKRNKKSPGFAENVKQEMRNLDIICKKKIIKKGEKKNERK